MYMYMYIYCQSSLRKRLKHIADAAHEEERNNYSWPVQVSDVSHACHATKKNHPENTGCDA